MTYWFKGLQVYYLVSAIHLQYLSLKDLVEAFECSDNYN